MAPVPLFVDFFPSSQQRPCIYFDEPHGFEWEEGTDPELLALPSINDAPTTLLPTLAVNVSYPDALMTWLITNNASLIKHLYIHCSAADDAPTPRDWARLLEKLSSEATNIHHLQVYWDWEWDAPSPKLPGMGKSLEFVRALGGLRPKILTICGFYGMHWPSYLEVRMGVKASMPQLAGGEFKSNGWLEELNKYQVGTEWLFP